MYLLTVAVSWGNS